jgi:hypothetical protein
MHVLVPLRVGEALWIAVMADPAIVVDGHAGDDPLRVVRLSQANDGNVLHMLDAVLRFGQSLPLDPASVECADDRTKIGCNPLTIVLKNPLQGMFQRIAIVPAKPEIYEAFSGLPAPRPSAEQDEYRGWRLP